MLLVRLGHYPSRARAQAAIDAGLVQADGRVLKRASEALSADAVIIAVPEHPYVSRGGVKLAHALDVFGIDPAGLVCLDAGCSTGGFTDVLLRRGARLVHAVDVGHGQFDAALARDARVRLSESTDIRAVPPFAADESPALAVADLSFISLRLVIPALARLAAPAARLVLLVKPQFEVGRARLGKGGIVRDAAARDEAVAAVRDALAAAGFAARPAVPSPVTGGDGNIEFLIAAARDGA
jgi:23S rRNA (cytidine1920-2'-O)/16S rRNA (cytidine1409-2'-O)-methyltransferase